MVGVVCRYLNDLYMLEIKEGTSLQWQKPTIEGSSPCVRESHSSLTWNSKLVVYGGMNGRRLSDVWLLDCDKWQWTGVTPHGPTPMPRSLHMAAIIKDR